MTVQATSFSLAERAAGVSWQQPQLHPRLTSVLFYLVSCLSPTHLWHKGQQFKVYANSRNLEPRNFFFIMDTMEHVRRLFAGNKTIIRCGDESLELWRVDQKRAGNCGRNSKELLPVDRMLCQVLRKPQSRGEKDSKVGLA